MKKSLIYILFMSSFIFAQEYNKHINSGFEKYKDKNYQDSEIDFRKGLDKNNKGFEANFNLGDALYKQGKFSEAEEYFKNSANITRNKFEKAESYHNLGNSLLKQNKLKESIEAYKNALRNNPNDQDTKYNLAYANELLRQHQQQNKNNEQKKKDKNNKDNKEEKNQDQNKDNKDQNKKDKQDQQPKNNEQQQDNTKTQKQSLDKREAESMLNAIRDKEKNLQKKLRKKGEFLANPTKDW